MEKFPSFSRLNLLCRRLLAACQALHFKGPVQVSVSEPGPVSRAEETLTGAVFSLFCWAFSQPPCRSTRQLRLAGKLPRSALNTTSKPSVSEIRVGHHFLLLNDSSSSFHTIELVVVILVQIIKSQNSFVRLFNRYLLSVVCVPGTVLRTGPQ